MSNDALTPKESESKKDGTARRWLDEIGEADKRMKRFLKEARECNEAYIGFKGDAEDDCSSYMAIYWSNIETMEPALYSATPKPVVTRRHQDRNPVARHASELLERGVSYFAQGEYLDPIIERDVSSYLRVGLAVDWVRYVADIETKKKRLTVNELGDYADDTGEMVNPSEIELLADKEGEYYEESQLNYEEVVCDPVHYADFRWGHCFTWGECPWVARRVRFRKDAAEKRFGKDKAEQLAFSTKIREDDDEDHGEDDEQAILFPEAEIWEIWCKESKTVYWVSKNCPDLLDKKKDPLKLQGFFPCPRPLIASHTDDSLIPRADYIIYRKQVEYIDTLTKRIHLLTQALLLKGVYDAQFPELAQLLESTTEKEMIPIDNFGQFMEKGGLEQMVRFFPVEVIAQTLKQLIALRGQAVQDVYEITGMSDILRGQSDPRETATAQQVKSQFAALRLRKRQREIQRYIRDLLAIKAEIIAEQFDDSTIMAIADAQPDELTMQALMLLKDDRLRSFRIDIETDSTIEADEIAEKQAANEFLTSVTGFLDTALAFSERAPAYAPVMGEFLGFIVRKYRAGRVMEDSIERASEEYQAQLQQKLSQPPQPDPRAQAAQMDAQMQQQKAQFDMQKAQADLQIKQAQLEAQVQKDLREGELKREEILTEAQMKKYEIDLEHDRKMEEIRQKQLESLATPLTSSY